MIKGFRCRKTEALFERGVCASEWQAFRRVARRKLVMLDAAAALNDLRVPPGNRLEALKDDRKGQHSIRINDQYRVCFVWNANELAAYQVEIVDDH